MGIPLMAGREFTDADVVGSQKVVDRQRGVREEVQARTRRGRQDDGLRPRLPQSARHGIVGVAQNAKYSEVKRQIPPVFFRAYRQDPDIGSASFYVRTAADPAQMASAVTAVVRRLDPNLPVDESQDADQQVRDNTFLDRMMTTLSSLFAGLATLLAAVGSLRRARLHRVAADARNRPADGARRGAVARPRDGAAPGGADDAGWRCGRAGGRGRASASRPDRCSSS